MLDATGAKTGVARPRSEVHSLGLFHRAVHTWIFCPATGEVVLQRRADCKDSWPGRWDISSAGHISAGGESLPSAIREVEEELGLRFAPERFRYLFTHLEMLDSVQKGKPFLNHEFNDVYLVNVSLEERSLLSPDNFVMKSDAEMSKKEEAEGASTTTSSAGAGAAEWAPNKRWELQASEVSAVCWRDWREVQSMYEGPDPTIVPTNDFKASYARLFAFLEAEHVAFAAGKGKGDASGAPSA